MPFDVLGVGESKPGVQTGLLVRLQELPSSRGLEENGKTEERSKRRRTWTNQNVAKAVPEVIAILQQLLHHRIHALDAVIWMRAAHIQAISDDDDAQLAVAGDVLVSQICQDHVPHVGACFIGAGWCRVFRFFGDSVDDENISLTLARTTLHLRK